jgi:hypothetical protein
MGVADFSYEAAAHDEEVRGSAIREDCDVEPDVCFADFHAHGSGVIQRRCGHADVRGTRQIVT